MEPNATNTSSPLLLLLDYAEPWTNSSWANNSRSTNAEWPPDEEWPDEEPPIYPSGYSQLRIVLTAFFVTCIMILIVVGNMLVCIAIATEKTLKTVQNWFIASLAVSDFLVGLVVMPFSLANELMGYWIFGRIWCEIHSALDVLLCTASINNLCLISLDRYWSVTHAVEYLKQRTPSRAIFMICFVWLLSALISLPPLVGWKKPEKPAEFPTCSLSDDVGYVLYSALGSFYIPAIVMVLVYSRIFVAARSRARRHVKKSRHLPELTNDPVRDKSTTTTTCTSFSNPSPPDKNKDGDSTPPSTDCRQRDEPLDNKPIAIINATPQIIIETPCESPEKRTAPTENGGGDNHYESSCDDHLRVGLLNAPGSKLCKSPFGSTLSLADFDRSDPDTNDIYETSSQKRKKKGKVQYQCEPLPRHTASDAERHKRKVAKARERRATLILGLIMASFILAWLPFFVLYVLEALCKTCYIGETGFAVAFWLGYCNSALNPIIYTIFNRDFRRAFRKILFK